ncbi:MAG: hypothetical protein WCI61_00695 [Chloroflexota bacterium]
MALLFQLRKPPPNPHEELTRYLSVDAFEATLRNGTLRFSSVEAMERLELPDRHEAHLPEWKVAQWNAWWQTRSAEDGWLPQWSELNAEEHVIESFRRQTGVSCWTHQAESLPMWSIYGDRAAGVAFVATAASIEAGLSTRHQNDTEIVFGGRIDYPNVDQLRELDVRQINPVSVGFIKRPVFAWETETRFAITHLHASPPFDIPMEPNILLKRILIGPKADEAIEGQVRALAKTFAPGVEVIRSTLLERLWE